MAKRSKKHRDLSEVPEKELLKRRENYVKSLGKALKNCIDYAKDFQDQEKDLTSDRTFRKYYGIANKLYNSMEEIDEHLSSQHQVNSFPYKKEKHMLETIIDEKSGDIYERAKEFQEGKVRVDEETEEPTPYDIPIYDSSFTRVG